MKISPHSGNCCGIKTISGFPWDPKATLMEKRESDQNIVSVDRIGEDFDTSENFYWRERPAETALERFDAYIDYLEQVRRYGLVEVSIITSGPRTVMMSGGMLSRLESGRIETFDEAVEHTRVVGYGFVEDARPRQYSGGCQDTWIPVFEERGFKLVSEFPNINSGNYVQVYHLVMDGEYYKAKKGDK